MDIAIMVMAAVSAEADLNLSDAIFSEASERWGKEEVFKEKVRLTQGIAEMSSGLDATTLSDEEIYWMTGVIARIMFSGREYQDDWIGEYN